MSWICCSGATRYSLIALSHEFAIEQHIVDVTDDDDFGLRLADLGKGGEFRQDRVTRATRFDNEQIGGRLGLECVERRP